MRDTFGFQVVTGSNGSLLVAKAKRKALPTKVAISGTPTTSGYKLERARPSVVAAKHPLTVSARDIYKVAFTF